MRQPHQSSGSRLHIESYIRCLVLPFSLSVMIQLLHFSCCSIGITNFAKVIRYDTTSLYSPVFQSLFSTIIFHINITLLSLCNQLLELLYPTAKQLFKTFFSVLHVILFQQLGFCNYYLCTRSISSYLTTLFLMHNHIIDHNYK